MPLRSGDAGRAARVVSLLLAGLVGLSGCGLDGPTASDPTLMPAPTSTAPVAAATPTPTTPSAQPSLVPDPDALAAALQKVSRKGIPKSSMVVLDVASGTTLYSRSDTAMIPASSAKVLTAAAALEVLGADARFTTSVVSSGKNQITLVGGGDPYLSDKTSKSAVEPASLQALANQVASSLKASKRTRIRLEYDTSRFSGASWNSGWKSAWRSFTPPVSALTINGGRYNQWEAHQNPAKVAAEAFAKRLKAAGITVTKVSPAADPVAGDAAVLASAQSATLSRILDRMLTESDNATAEIVARQAALATGRAASFGGATATIKAFLTQNGLWSDDARIADGSGFSRKTKVRASTLAGVIALALTDERYSALTDGLPVAGKTGTLKDRFNDKSERAGRGVVHAKTGTLATVASLTGYLTTSDGALLAFSAISSGAGGTTGANWLDRSAAVLARCGCQS